jgi:hypothetical protein
MLNPGQKMVMRGGMMIPEGLVIPQNSMIPNRIKEDEKTKPKPLDVKPLSQKMSIAYDNIANNEKEEELSPKYVVALGKLALEIEQVKNNLQSIAQEVQASNRKKKELDDQELKLLEDEKDRLTALGASFRGFRRRLGGITALIAGKQFLEGDISGGIQNASIAVGALLPDIVRLTSGVVLGGMLRGGGRGVVAPRGGGRGSLLPLLLGGGGLLGLGSFLGSRGSGDQRRFELTKREAFPQLLSQNDVRRFRLTTDRFDNILSNVNNNKLNITTSPFTSGVAEDVKLPPTVGESIGDDKDKILNFLGVDDKEESDEEETESLNTDNIERESDPFVDNYMNMFDIQPLFLNSLPQDLTNDDLAFLDDDTMGENINVFDFGGDDDGQNNKMEGVKYSPQLVSSSNISVNPEFSDNSKISYILQYGGGAVV